MIRYLQNDRIDKPKWDACILNAVNGNLTAFSWYLDLVSPGWCALVEGEYERVFPLPVAEKLGIKYIMQPYFTQQLGLFYDTTSPVENLEEFIAKIPLEFKYIDINLNTSNRLPTEGVTTNMVNLELDLISDYEKIVSGYQTNLKRNLKKASQSKLTLVKQIRPEELIALFKSNKGQDLKHLGLKEYNLMQRIAYESIHKGMGEIWAAYDEHNELVAGVLWVKSHQKVIFLFSALSESGKLLNAMPWLIDTFIQHNSGQPLTLDFEGSNDEGLARFYAGFGSKRVIYQRYRRNTLALPFRIVLKMWRLSRSVIKNR